MKDRGYEDSYGFALVASGRADIHLHVYVKIWDVAAAKIIIEEAGGQVSDLDGNDIDLKFTKDSFGVFATNGVIHDQAPGTWKMRT